MKIGICTSINNISKVESLGFDYIECAVVEIAKLMDEEFDRVLKSVSSSKISCKAFNVLFPGDISVVGPNVDYKTIEEYIENAFDRISKLGAEVVVFGSGAARKCPDGWSKDEAFSQLVKTSKIVGDVAQKYGITIVIEPLNRGETNIINSVAEGYELVKEVNHKNIKLLADFYHMRKENESMGEVEKAGTVIRHIHIANSSGRYFPFEANEDIYDEFISMLKKIDYSGGISIEGRSDDFEADAIKSLQFLKTII